MQHISYHHHHHHHQHNHHHHYHHCYHRHHHPYYYHHHHQHPHHHHQHHHYHDHHHHHHHHYQQHHRLHQHHHHHHHLHHGHYHHHHHHHHRYHDHHHHHYHHHHRLRHHHHHHHHHHHQYVLTMAMCSSFSCSLRSLSMASNHRCCHFLVRWFMAGWPLSRVLDPDRVNDGVRCFSLVNAPEGVNLSRDFSRVNELAGLPPGPSLGILLLPRRAWLLGGSGVMPRGATLCRLLADFVSLS